MSDSCADFVLLFDACVAVCVVLIALTVAAVAAKCLSLSVTVIDSCFTVVASA